MMNRRALLALALWPNAARAHSFKVGNIAVGHAWALPAAQGIDGQVFMPLLNTGEVADALIAARCDDASLIELRRNARYDDPAEVQFDLAPRQPLPMRPGARHLRLIGLRHPLQLNHRFKLVLDFLNAGELEVEVHVEDQPKD